MSIWYAICDFLPFEMLSWDFMKNATLAILLMAPLFGILSTMIVTGRMSFFSDALGHSAFTGIAIGAICGIAAPIWVAVIFSVVFALLFSYVRSRSNHAADTIIGVFSSTAVALGIFIATLGGGSFTKYNKYLIGDILSVTSVELTILGVTLLGVLLFWVLCSTAHSVQYSSRAGILPRNSCGGYANSVHHCHRCRCYSFHLQRRPADSQFSAGSSCSICTECRAKSEAVSPVRCTFCHGRR